MANSEPGPRHPAGTSRSDSTAEHSAGGFAEADRGAALPRAPGALDDLVAVLNEGARFARGKLHWLFAALGEFHQRAAGPGRSPGDRARAQQIARPQVATVGAVVGDELRHGPVRVTEARVRKAHGGLHLARLQVDLDLDVEPYLLRSGLLGVLSQRLVRRLCACARPGAQVDVVGVQGDAGELGVHLLQVRVGCLADLRV